MGIPPKKVLMDTVPAVMISNERKVYNRCDGAEND